MPSIMNPVFPGTCISQTWRNANNASIPYGCIKYPWVVKQQETLKKVYAGA